MEPVSRAWTRFREWWAKLSSEDRKNYIRGAALCGGGLVLLGFFYLNGGDEEKAPTRAPEPEEEFTSDDYLDRDIEARIEAAVNRALEEERKNKAHGNTTLPTSALSDDLGLLDGDPIEPNDYAALDELAFDSSGVTYPAPSSTPVPTGEPLPAPQAVMVGGIDNEVVYTPAPPPPSQEGAQKIPIPPGFMPGKMLVGVHAQVSSAGSNSPKPIHIRVQAPATLPNDIKLQLAGCFVIANTWGNLASERIEGETVSITCMTSDKKTIIEGALKGYLADVDGQRDISGRVVTKMGSLLGRKFLADTLSGFGNSIEQGVGSVAVSPLGTVSDFDARESAQKGLASGVAGGFNGLGEYLTELIEQSGPVIESGAARDLMIMVQETSWMTITHIDDAKTLNGDV